MICPSDGSVIVTPQELREIRVTPLELQQIRDHKNMLEKLYGEQIINDFKGSRTKLRESARFKQIVKVSVLFSKVC